MDNVNALSAPMIGKSRTEDDPYWPADDEEEEIDKPQYLAAVGALLYLVTNTQPDISFTESVLARYSKKTNLIMHQRYRDDRCRTMTKQIEVKKIASANIADFLTKVLPAPQHRNLIIAVGMRTLNELE
jgi:hypothetical protein